MLIIVTGAIGIGKTTVCRKVVEKAKRQGHACGGILTGKAPDRSITIEDIQTGQSLTLASVNDIYGGPHAGQYYFNPEAIDFGRQAIDRGSRAAILVVDEIGPLELNAEGFTNAVDLIRQQKFRHCVVVIRSGLLDLFLPRLGNAPLIFDTSAASRDRLPDEISGKLSCP